MAFTPSKKSTFKPVISPKEEPIKTNLFGNSGLGRVANALTASEQGFGKDIAQGIYGTFGGQKTIDKISQQNLDTGDRLIKLAKETSDPIRKGKLNQMALDAYKAAGQTADDIMGRMSTTGEILGHAGGTLLDVLSAGTYGKATAGMKFGQLAPKIAKPLVKETAKKTAGQTFKSIAGKTATGAATGYGYDVTGKLQEGKTGKEAFTPGLGTALGTVIPLASGIKEARKATRAVTEDATKLASRITQSPKEKSKQALAGLKEIAIKPSKIKSFDDLSNALNTSLKGLVESADNVYALNKTKITSNKAIEDNGTDYITHALDGLEELYKTTIDPEGVKEVLKLRGKYLQEGLSAEEINRLSREYSSELGSKAFGKTGEQLTSTNATKLENIRSGLKATARNILGDDAAKDIDKRITDAIVTKELIDNLSKKAYEFENATRRPGILGGIKNISQDILTTISGGVFRGGLSGLSRRTGVVGGELNPVQLQKELKKNIELLDKLLSAPNESVARKIIREITSDPRYSIKAFTLPNNE